MIGPAAARELAARIGTLADCLDDRAQRFWTLAYAQDAMGRIGAATALGDFDAAAAKLKSSQLRSPRCRPARSATWAATPPPAWPAA